MFFVFHPTLKLIFNNTLIFNLIVSIAITIPMAEIDQLYCENFPPLTIASINCNSLNMSVTSRVNQKRKIYGIVKLKTDIIFMSDIRLCNKNLVSLGSELKKLFLINPYQAYEFIHNSKRSKRGVGILYKKDLNLSVEASTEDPEDNYILTRVSLKGTSIILGSVYGPNEYDPEFFARLGADLNRLGNYPVILGGDWNCTFSTDPVASNIDCINMANLPNIRHSRLLSNLCDRFKLTDPYRVYFPTRRDFSYRPRNLLQKNKSRIDFFLMSEDLLMATSNCDMALGLQSKLLDHKAIYLSFNCNKKN